MLPLAIALLVLVAGANAQTYRIAQMNSEQIRRLNKEKTVVLIPGGILEEHGPYLPSFTDGYWHVRLTNSRDEASLKHENEVNENRMHG